MMERTRVVLLELCHVVDIAIDNEVQAVGLVVRRDVGGGECLGHGGMERDRRGAGEVVMMGEGGRNQMRWDGGEEYEEGQGKGENQESGAAGGEIHSLRVGWS